MEENRKLKHVRCVNVGMKFLDIRFIDNHGFARWAYTPVHPWILNNEVGENKSNAALELFMAPNIAPGPIWPPVHLVFGDTNQKIRHIFYPNRQKISF